MVTVKPGESWRTFPTLPNERADDYMDEWRENAATDEALRERPQSIARQQGQADDWD